MVHLTCQLEAGWLLIKIELPEKERGNDASSLHPPACFVDTTSGMIRRAGLYLLCDYTLVFRLLIIDYY
jgi:hypothetical protein